MPADRIPGRIAAMIDARFMMHASLKCFRVGQRALRIDELAHERSGGLQQEVAVGPVCTTLPS